MTAPRVSAAAIFVTPPGRSGPIQKLRKGFCVDRLTPEALAYLQARNLKRHRHPIASTHETGGRPHAYCEDLSVAALKVTEFFHIDPENNASLTKAQEVLPARLFTALFLTCGCFHNIEEVEDMMALPARSAKVLLVTALEDLIARGVI